MSTTAIRGVPRIELSPADGARLARALDRLRPDDEDLDGLLAGLLQTASVLPRDVVRSLLRFRAAPDAPAALVLGGLPTDEALPPTPTTAAPTSARPITIAEHAVLLVGIMLGEPVAYAGEKNGAIVQHVFPTRAQRTASSNESSAIALEFHTELTYSEAAPAQSFDVAAPDFVLLLALRSPPDRSAVTSIVDGRELCRALDRQHLAALRRPQYQLRAPRSFMGDRTERPWSRALSLIRGSADAPALAFDIACGVRALSAEAQAALAALRDACADPALQQQVRLQPGELLAIDNNRCAHARSPYEARFDGGDRWLLRSYIRRDIRDLTTASANSFRTLA